MEKTLNEVKAIIQNLAGRTKVDSNLLPTFGIIGDFAHPHIEIDKQGYHYVVENVEENKVEKQQIALINFYIGYLKILHSI